MEAQETQQATSLLGNLDVALQESGQTKDTADKISVSIWDFGGQRVFYTVHHLFLTEGSIYILVFNMLDILSNEGTVQSKCIARLKLWLNSISMHASNAPLLIVGTHKDSVGELSQHVSISKILQTNYQSIPSFRDHVVKNGKLSFFPVNNMNSRDEVLEELRSQISSTIRANGNVKQPVPFSWISLLDALRNLSKTSQITKFSDVMAIAKECGFPTNPVVSISMEASQALKYFHNLGYLVFYNEKDLHDLIILEPQWLINNITVIIRDHTHLHPQEIDATLMSEFPVFWDAFINEGKINALLLTRLWPDVNEKALKHLMIKFGLLVQLSKGDYLVPALLPDIRDPPKLKDSHRVFLIFDVDSKVMSDYQKSTTALPLKLLKNRSYLPAGLFDRIVCGLVAWVNPEFHRRDTLRAFEKKFVHGFISGVEFVIENNTVSGFITIDTAGATANPVLEVIKFLITSIKKNIFPSLTWDFFVQPNSCIQENSVFTYTAINTAFQDRETLQPLMTKAGVFVDPSELNVWFLLFKQLATYDLFISYRQKANRKLADVLCRGFHMFESIDNRRYEIFWDNIRLEIAIEFNIAFTKALYSSAVVMPLISSETLRSLKINCATNAVDNVLLEWWMSLIFLETRRHNPTGSLTRLTNIFPLVCLHDDEIILTPESFAGTKKIIFEMQKDLPNEVHQPTLSKLRDMLRHVDLQVDPKYYQLTVRDIVDKIMDNKAVFLPHLAEFISSVTKWSSLKSPDFVPNSLAKLLSLSSPKTANPAVDQTPSLSVYSKSMSVLSMTSTYTFAKLSTYTTLLL